MEYDEFCRLATLTTGSVFRQVQRWDYFSKKTMGDQIFRAAVSVVSNAAEGRGRGERQERQFLNISLGSCNEVIVQLGVCGVCKLIPRSTSRDLIAKYKEMRGWLESQIRVLDGEEGSDEAEDDDTPF